MRRFLAFAAALGLVLLVFAPRVFAATPMPQTGRVLLSTQGDVTIPAGDQADVVVVIQGAANIQGTVNTLVVIDGTATLTGAQLESVVAVRSQVEVGSGTVVTGEVQRLDSTVDQTGDGDIQGGITDLSTKLFQAGAALAPALMLLWLGFGLAMLVAAVLLAGLAARQVRQAERFISDQPLLTWATGFLGAIVIPVGTIVLFVSVIGAPLAFGLLFQVLPLVALAGYLVAAIWIGEWLIRRTSTPMERERPYLGSVVGVVVLGVVGFLPVLGGFLVMVASVMGFGAIIRLGIQTLRGPVQPAIGTTRPVVARTGA